MTEAMIAEAVRAVSPVSAADPAAAGAAGAVQAAQPGADPAAVSRFQQVMGADAVEQVGGVPFVDQMSASWHSAQQNYQGIIHRIRALAELGGQKTPAMGELMELQYEVMNVSFLQTMVSKVSDRVSTAVQTLVKNQ